MEAEPPGEFDPTKVSERTRRRLEEMSPEKRARIEALLARTQSPEYRARERAEREILDREYRQTGTISRVSPAERQMVLEFVVRLEQSREALGLSLADVAGRSGIDQAALSRLENGRNLNPKLATLARYAAALGKRVALSLEDERGR